MDAGYFFTDQILPIIWKTAFLWVPVGLGVLGWFLWMKYVNHQYLEKIDWILLEIKIPRLNARSPAAMELVLMALLQTGGTTTFINRWWEGKLRAWFSLEIASIEGNVYFFIRAERKFRLHIESQIYAQYSNAEVTIVDDYVRYVEKYVASNQWSMFGAEWKLAKEDAYPIKTYVDYKLNETGVDAEEKIDPLAGIIETMGAIGKGEQMWMQIIVQATQDRFEIEGKISKKQNWVKESQALVDKLIRKKKDGDKEVRDLMGMTQVEKDLLTAVERSMTKPAFDVGMRTIYLAQKQYFRPEGIIAMMGMFRQFGSHNLNGFKPALATDKDYPWQKFGGAIEKLKHDMFEAYQERGWFYSPYKNETPPFVLNVEELATVFHFPSNVVETPTFERVESTKAEPPANLPI